MYTTYAPERRDEILHDLSLLRIHGENIYKLEVLGSIFIDNKKFCNVFRRFNSTYQILLETDDQTIHFQKDIRILDSLSNILGSRMDSVEVVAAYSYKHHGAFIPSEAFHLPTLQWSELHHTWHGVSLYLESLPQERYTPLQEEASHDEVSHDEASQEESEDDWAYPSASPLTRLSADVPSAPIKHAPATVAAYEGLSSVRRCLSERFTALLKKRTLSEQEEASQEESEQEEASQEESEEEEEASREESEQEEASREESEEEEASQEESEQDSDCFMVLRNGTKYPRHS